MSEPPEFNGYANGIKVFFLKAAPGFRFKDQRPSVVVALETETGLPLTLSLDPPEAKRLALSTLYSLACMGDELAQKFYLDQIVTDENRFEVLKDWEEMEERIKASLAKPRE